MQSKTSQVSSTELENLNKIKIITYPDKIFDSSVDILLINLSSDRLSSFQKDFLNLTNISCNVYVYDAKVYEPTQLDWLLSIFRTSKLTILDLNHLSPYLQDFIIYFLANPTTFWLTDTNKPQYNHISKNKIYSFEFLQHLGGNFEKE